VFSLLIEFLNLYTPWVEWKIVSTMTKGFYDISTWIHEHWNRHTIVDKSPNELLNQVSFFSLLFLAFDFCRFCRHNGQWPPTLKDFLSQILSTTSFFLS